MEHGETLETRSTRSTGKEGILCDKFLVNWRGIWEYMGRYIGCTSGCMGDIETKRGHSGYM